MTLSNVDLLLSLDTTLTLHTGFMERIYEYESKISIRASWGPKQARMNKIGILRSIRSRGMKSPGV